MSDHDELLRLRDRVHKQASDIAALRVLLEAFTSRMSHAEDQLRSLVDEDRIAEQVAYRIRQRRAQLFSWPVKLGAVIAAVATVLNLGIRLWTLWHG